MDEHKIISLIERDPYFIKRIENPTEEMKLTAVRKDGMTIRYIKEAVKQKRRL